MANIPTPTGSPGVRLQTIDLSLTISPKAALYVAALLPSNFGESDKIIDLGSEAELVDVFGEPTSANYEEWFNISRVWKYKVAGLGATIKVVRAVGDGSLNGTVEVSKNEVIANPTTQLIQNREEATTATIVFDEDSNATPVDACLKLFTAFPTSYGYKIALATSTDFATADIVTGVSFKDNFEVAPETDEVAIAVLDEGDNIIEKWVVAGVPGHVDGYGQDIYLETVLNEKSKYIYGFINDSISFEPVSFEAVEVAGGVNVAPAKGDLALALDKFKNTEAVDVNYVLAHPDLHAETITLCESRQDCAFRAGVPVSTVVGMPQGTALENVSEYSDNVLTTSTSYGSIAANALFVFDKYNNKSWWINAAGDMIGLRVMQNLSSQPFFSDAGLNHGKLKEVRKLAQYWDANDIRTLQEKRFIPIILKQGVGIVKWGQRNYFSKPSALRDEGVRELINYVWRAAKVFLSYKLFDFNDGFTRSSIETKIRRFLANVQDSRGIRRRDDGSDGFVARCDSTNNPSDVINQNMLVVDVGFLPARAIEEIWFRVSIASDGIQLDKL